MSEIKDVYSKIAKEFNRTRWNVWPNVGNFIDSFEPNTVNGDIGCGNGKNMLHRTKDIKFIGVDICPEFLDICISKKIEVIQGNILNIPMSDSYFDNTICIAVIHHFKTKEERIKAIKELIRVTKNGGKILIYVWAFEQPEGSIRKFTEQDSMVPFQSRVSGIYYRFYHVYKQGELSEEIKEATSYNFDIYYDNGNWCAIINL